MNASAAQRSPRHGTGIASCPGCDQPPLPLSFFEVPIDWCTHCGGVWLDGGELEALRAEVARLGGVSAAEATTPYRSRAAAQALVMGLVHCAKCGAQVPVNQTYVTGEGTLCTPCGMAVRGEMPAAETERQVDEFLDRTRRLDQQMYGAEAVEEANRAREDDEARARRWGAAGSVVNAVLAVFRAALGHP